MSGAGERSKLKYVHCRRCELSTPEECDGLYLTDEMADLNERKIAAESEAALQQRENATLRARLAESEPRVRELEAAVATLLPFVQPDVNYYHLRSWSCITEDHPEPCIYCKATQAVQDATAALRGAEDRDG